MRQEWAVNADDVLWRRTKLGLRLTADEAEALDGWMAARRAGAAGVMPAPEPARQGSHA